MKDIITISKHGLMSKLYKRDLYTSKDNDYLINRRIIEYDIKSAGFNLSKYYKLLPKEILNDLEKMNKKDRHIAIGKLQRDNKEYAKNLSKAFQDIRKEFFISNRIVDSDILSIRKDAIFIVGKKCRNLEFGNIQFVEKNVYSSYHNLNNIEFYYSSKRDILDVKGINNDSLYQYSSFMNILKRLFKLLENGQREEFVKFMKRFSEDYKNKNLKYDYYKEFRSDGAYTLIQKDGSTSCITLDGMDSTIDDKLSITYNYIQYILPLIQRHYFNL